jgi:hypothetical protein
VRAVGFQLAVVCCVLAAGPVQADGASLWPEPGRGALAGRIGYHDDDQLAATQRVLTPAFVGHYAFSRHWSMSAEGGFLWIGAEPRVGDDSGALALGNPTGLAYFTPWPGARHRLRLGLGGSLPLSLVARGGAGRLQRAGISTAAGMEGLARMELWAPARGAFVGLVQLHGPITDMTSYELRARTALSLAVVRHAGENRADVFVPLSAGIRSRNEWLEGGVFAMVVLTPTSNVDALQLSFAPHVRVHRGRAWFGVRVVAPVDEPLAGSRGPRVWGAFLESGGSL